MVALFIGFTLFLSAGALAVQTMEIHRRTEVKYQAAMVGRQAMELWKADQTLPREVDLSGHRYEIQYRQRGGANGYILWEVEVGDEGGKQFSCRRLAQVTPPSQRMDDDGFTVGHDFGRPDVDSLPAPSQSDRASR